MSVGPGAHLGLQAVTTQVTVINLVVGCHYFSPGPPLPFQPQRVTAFRRIILLGDRDMLVNNLPRIYLIVELPDVCPTTFLFSLSLVSLFSYSFIPSSSHCYHQIVS